MIKDLPTDEDVAASYNETLSASKTAEILGINVKTVYKALNRKGILRKGLTHYRQNAKRFPDDVEREIVRRYLEGERTADLAKEFGSGGYAVRQAVRRQGEKVRPSLGKASLLSAAEKNEICEKYKEGMSLVSLAMVYKAHSDTVKKILLRNMIPIRRQRKHSSPKYRYTGTQGYIWAKIPRTDPLVVMASAKCMIQEHRLVMARHLGRPLSTNESVHHINGDRTDNRIENLQLRQGNHGKHEAMCCLDCGSQRIGPCEIKG